VLDRPAQLDYVVRRRERWRLAKQRQRRRLRLGTMPIMIVDAEIRNLGVGSSNLSERANNVAGNTELFLAGAFAGCVAAAR
jgi:hypothetical protein